MVISILLITTGFSMLLPGLEMKTEYEEFMPENDILKSQIRIYDYFGESGDTVLLYVEKNGNVDSVLDVKVLREEYNLQKNLDKLSFVNGSFSIMTSLIRSV